MSDAPEKLDVPAIQAIFDRSAMISFMGLKAETVDYDTMVFTARMPLRDELARGVGSGQFHGGAIAAFIDTVGDFAVGMMVGGGVPTTNMRVDYMRPAINTDLIGIATVRRMGRSIAVVDIDVTNEDGKLLAIGRANYVPKTG
ncbi:PaaI family thioesterase [Pseudooceanicola nanhaiensis]|uniref:PaaI family thioesterase n=1 Tax=Pseudooceanicola nanhaiensis TaxID=375761 RepID=UPI001CD4B927|nr:PaaI family thioesterase [Pseudooceanicola nanhaiensis]MCA0921924.1 PaaI family thioesterase [Pseudooceanicola nanhaiensis]